MNAGSTQRTLALVLVGVGVAGLVVGAVSGAMSISAHGTYEQSCGSNIGAPPGQCNGSGVSGQNDAATKGTISTVAFVGGGRVGAAGAILFLTAPSGASTRRLAWGWEAFPSKDSSEATWRWLGRGALMKQWGLLVFAATLAACNGLVGNDSVSPWDPDGGARDATTSDGSGTEDGSSGIGPGSDGSLGEDAGPSTKDAGNVIGADAAIDDGSSDGGDSGPPDAAGMPTLAGGGASRMLRARTRAMKPAPPCRTGAAPVAQA